MQSALSNVKSQLFIYLNKALNVNIIELNKQICFFYEQNFSSSLFDINYLQENNLITGRSVGRGTTWFLQHQKKKYVWRHYYRGGLIGKINADKFLYAGFKKTRAYQEFVLLEKMVQLDLPVPVPYAGKISRNGIFYQADIMIELIEGADDLIAILGKQSLSKKQWQEIGRVIRLFHEHNIFHSDMNSHNIMLDAQEKVWLIDFDKCAQRPSGPWKELTLARLLRSFHKEKDKNSELQWSEQDWSFLLAGYQA